MDDWERKGMAANASTFVSFKYIFHLYSFLGKREKRAPLVVLW